MFDNIGGKIKKLAEILCWVGIIASLVLAIVLWAGNSYRTPTIALGFGVLVGGAIGFWVGSFFMYGFGELIEETTRNRQLNAEILKQLSQRDKSVDVSKVNTPNQPENAEFLNQISQQRMEMDEIWVCKKCRTVNFVADGMRCKGCNKAG